MATIVKMATVYFGEDNLRITPNHPQIGDPDNIDTPLITYTMKKKEPGLIGEGVREIRSKERGSQEIELINQETDEAEEVTLVFMGQRFDYTVEFDIWDADPIRADETREEFERFMRQYTGYFQQQGIDKLYFESAEDNHESGKWGSTLNHRRITYLIRLDEVVGVQIARIASITAYLKVHTDPNTFYVSLLDNDYYTTNSPHQIIFRTPEETQSDN